MLFVNARKGNVYVIKLGDKRRPAGVPYKNVYVGRGTPVGNKNILGKDGDRDEVCDLYEKQWPRFKHNREVKEFLRKCVKYLDDGVDVYLMCHCAPERCHADTIKRHLDNITI